MPETTIAEDMPGTLRTLFATFDRTQVEFYAGSPNPVIREAAEAVLSSVPPVTVEWVEVARARALAGDASSVTCSCGQVHPAGAKFMVSVFRDSQADFALGPFDDHQTALAQVDRAKALAADTDPMSFFWSWGTCAVLGETSPDGKLNHHFTVGDIYPEGP